MVVASLPLLGRVRCVYISQPYTWLLFRRKAYWLRPPAGEMCGDESIAVGNDKQAAKKQALAWLVCTLHRSFRLFRSGGEYCNEERSKRLKDGRQG